MGVIKAVCTSNIKGIQKTEQATIKLKPDWGIEGDAHAAPWHRQVSLLSYEQIEAFKDRGADVDNGAFGENIIVEGFDLKNLPIGTRLACNDVVLELTQIGKKCHAHCAIYHRMGDCIMPREGIFCKVLAGGTISPGDIIEIA
ncbi:MOSC domain-containing protein [Adlercreutzia shanghongiae]|uniref:MOSC domain-containing protein n=1 Tax=Adlercreutzia shanghongiae TaxID=3111773 RepID=A0ABU6IYH9_9ACTN|nr:MOSC domain-containing protein [Adlercreutzia sp. R22]MEC4294904.1 MOSC domain-containing protein [Adlercreutzia sp. R22]